MYQPIKTLRAYHIFALSLIAIVNLREYPILASMGAQVVEYTALAFLGFLLPSAWVCAQLSAKFPSQGGLYTWFREAFGCSWGRLGMSIEWLNNMISFPATCAVVIATILTGCWPAWQPSSEVTVVLTLLLCWLCVFVCCRGVLITYRLSGWAALLGVLMPTVCIIVLGVIWVFSDHPIAWQITASSVSSTDKGFEWGLLVSVLSAYAGMQASAFFAPQVDSPGRTYPLALISCAVVIVCITAGAGLAMAAVIPQDALSYMDGVMACFQLFLAAFHLSQYSIVLVFLIVLGAFAGLCTWMQALSRGVHQMAVEHQWPRYFATLNARSVPVRVLTLQGVLVSVLLGLFLCVPDMQTAFWLLVLLTSQLTVLLYMALFIAAVRLLLPYQQTWQRCITVLASVCGVCCSALGLVVSFWKPSHVIWSQSVYVEVVATCDGVLILLCAFWYCRRARIKPVISNESA